MDHKRKKTKPKDVDYKVKKILKKRITVEGNIEYLLKWRKFGKSENSWEPVKNLNCPELIEAHENYLKNKLSSKKRKLKIASNIKIDAANSKDRASSIGSLPEDILIEIFSYFTQNELCRFARVCRKWNMCIQNPILWKSIDVKFGCLFGSVNETVSIFSKRIPTCLTRMLLNFTDLLMRQDSLHFQEFCMDLRKRCPNLQSLILISSKLPVRLESAIDICSHFLPELEVLAFRNCIFGEHMAKEKYNDASKIKVFDFHSSFCRFTRFENLFSKMPNLTKLYLSSTDLSNMWLYDVSLLQRLEVLEFGWSEISRSLFHNLLNNASNLTELYLCGTKIQDFNFVEGESQLTHLKTICLYGSDATCDGRKSLILSCPFLETIYVMEDLIEHYIKILPDFILDKYIPNIIKGVQGYNHHAHCFMKF